MSERQAALPKLVYIGDVPVEESFAGSTLLYRLLSDYPAERLAIVESNLQPGGGGRRLKGVRYQQISVGNNRLLRTRLRAAYGFALALAAPRNVAPVKACLGSSQPEAVVTVGHGVSWLIAHNFARLNRIPLHLMMHDDWRETLLGADFAQPWIGRQFRRVYNQASECYTISPYMKDEYQRELGRRATVLLPLRGEDGRFYNVPKPPRGGPLTFAYAGGLHNRGYRDLVFRLAGVLSEGERVLCFSPVSQSDVPAELAERLIIRQPLTPAALIETLRAEADVLFCPSSFLPHEQHAMAINLPSKLAEYTAVGAPIVVWGPADSSPVKWEREHPGAAIVETANDDAAARAIVEKLYDRNLREQHGRIALTTGLSLFSPSRVREQFYAGLRRHYREPLALNAGSSAPVAAGERRVTTPP